MRIYRTAATLLLLLLVAVMPVFASLGESAAEIEKRYGPARGKTEVSSEGVITRYYISNDVGISVKFMDGKSQSEIYEKADRSDFSPREVAVLLDASRLGSDWLNIYESADSSRWELRSRAAAAFHFHNNHLLVISTKEFIRSGNKIRLLDENAPKPGKN